jgi:quinol monooxygenase YgiN
MRSGEGVRFVLRIEVSDVERFKALVARCVAISRDEPGTLVYDWYLDEERGQARLYEAYESADAVKAHARGPVFTEVGPELVQTCRFTDVEAFGDTAALQGGLELGPTTWWGPAFEAVRA